MSSRPQADSATPMAVRLPLHAESAGAACKIVPPHLIYPLIHVIVTRRDASTGQKVFHWTRPEDALALTQAEMARNAARWTFCGVTFRGTAP